MLELLGASENVVFSAALVLMLLIGVVEVIGLGGGLGHDLDADGPDADGPGGGDLLAWLGVGRLPLLMLLVVFLSLFGLIGLAGQQLAADLLGAPVTSWIAAPLAAIAALPLTGIAARGLARVLPRDETSAVELDTLVGRTATVVTGRAAAGSPARARVEDRHGQAHYLMVEPNDPAEGFGEGDAVLLVRREGHLFRGVGRGDNRLPRLEY